jgi:hypothetical protein
MRESGTVTLVTTLTFTSCAARYIQGHRRGVVLCVPVHRPCADYPKCDERDPDPAILEEHPLVHREPRYDPLLHCLFPHVVLLHRHQATPLHLSSNGTGSPVTAVNAAVNAPTLTQVDTHAQRSSISTPTTSDLLKSRIIDEPKIWHIVHSGAA